jgi:phage terminase large subunit GpA-like protein
MESFDDPTVQTTVLCMASRIGKTETMLNLIGQTIDEDPSNILVVYPTIDAAKNFFAESIQPMLTASRCFRGRVGNPLSKDGRNTQLKKRFAGGTLRGIGANVPSAFSGVQARRVIADEIDAMEEGKEGDPVSLMLKRAENYSNAVQVLASTPTTTDGSRIWKWLEKSDFRKWFVVSPRTGNEQLLEWENVKWEEGKPETATYYDPETQEPWTEQERRDAIEGGRWKATRPHTGIRGYWADGMISLFAPKKGFVSKLHQFVAEYEEAKAGGHESMRVWMNTFRCLPSQEEAQELDWELIKAKAEQYDVNPMPEPVLLVTLSADVQQDRLEMEWVGWSEGFESYGLGYKVLYGDTKRDDVWKHFRDELNRTWTTTGGVKLKLARAFVDEGFATERVRKFCLEMLRSGVDVYPCKGIGKNSILEPEMVTYRNNPKQKGIRCPAFNVGVNRAKRQIFSHVMLDPPGDMTMHYPEGHGYDDKYYEMLCGEKIVTAFAGGRPYKKFVPIPNRRNEALDIRGYNLAAAISLNPSWDAIRENLDKQRELTVEAKDSLTQADEEARNPVLRKRIQPMMRQGFNARTW